MEKDGSSADEEVAYDNLFSRVLKAVSLAGIILSFVSFIVLLPSTIGSLGKITAQNPYDYFLVNLASTNAGAITVLIVSGIALSGSLLTLFLKKGIGSTGTRIDNLSEFYKYISAFILMEFVLSLIAPQISPSFSNSPVLSFSIPVQNFIFVSSTLSEVVVEQFVPLSILTIGYLALTGKFTRKAFLNPDRILGRALFPIAIVASAATSLLTSPDVGAGVLNFFSFLFLDYIYIRFGLTRALVAGFTISQFNILLQVYPSSPLPYAMSGFLILWSLLGMFWVLSALFGRYRYTGNQQTGDSGKADHVIEQDETSHPIQRYPQGMAKPENLWVRSFCPSCGNYNYAIKEDMSMECKNCHQVIDKDAVGEFNIRLSRTGEIRS